jgi:hypothetical protein
MDFTTYVRKPFVIQAVEITEENIGEVAKFVGELRGVRDGNPHILVNSELVPNVDVVFPGYYMTKMGSNVRCYSKRSFENQFIEKDENVQPWLDWMSGRHETKPPEAVL